MYNKFNKHTKDSGWLFLIIFQVYRELREAERQLQVQSMQLECSVKGVLRENVLQRFISEHHWNGLKVVPVCMNVLKCLL